MALFCTLTGMSPSEYKRLTVLEYVAFQDAAKYRYGSNT